MGFQNYLACIIIRTSLSAEYDLDAGDMVLAHVI